MSGERKCRDGLATRAGPRGDPRAAVLQSVNVLGSKGRAGFLLSARSWRPRVPDVIQCSEVASDHDECAHETTKRYGASHGHRGRVRKEADEEARDTRRGEHGRNSCPCNDEEGCRCPDHPMSLSKGHGAAHTDMYEGEEGDNEETCLPKGQG